MKIILKNKENEIIYSQFTHECFQCIKSCNVKYKRIMCEIHKGQKIIGVKTSNLGSCFACSNSPDLIKSSKTFRKKIELTLLTLNEIEKIKTELNKEANKLTHNLTKTNAHNIQELYALVPQDILSNNYKEQLNIIKNTIEDDPFEAAKTFLRIAKNNAAMKVEFSSFKKLFSGAESLNYKLYNIKKVTLNVFHLFFPQFKDVNVYVDIGDYDKSIYIDYDSIHVILYHIIDNATKYILPNSTLKVLFNDNGTLLEIIFEMISLQIKDDEINSIYSEGIRGDAAIKLKKVGNGIGFYRISKVLDLIGGEFIIENNIDSAKRIKKSGVFYEKNRFILRLNKTMLNKGYT